MHYIATLGGRQFSVESNIVLSPEQINSYAAQKLGIPAAQGGGCPSCAGKAGAKAAGNGMVKLGTATCGGPYLQNSSHTMTGSITSGGTAPFTYTWTITKPDTTTETLTGASQPYTFAQTGTYGIRLDVSDSCPGGAKTDFSTCSVTVSATCPDPACSINIA